MDRDGPATDRFACPSPQSCSICATKFALFRGLNEPNSSFQNTVRVIKSSAPYCMGQVVFMNSHGLVRYSSDPNVDVAGSHPSLAQGQINEIFTAPYFLVHDSCWNYIVCQIPSIYTEAQICRGLSQFLNATTTKAVPTVLQYIYVRCIPGARGSALRHAITYKSPFPNPDDLFRAENPPNIPPTKVKCLLRQIVTPSDPFARLPIELLNCISENLSIHSFCTLREASRAFALVTRKDDLHLGFWYSKFCAGGELGFLLIPDSYLRNLTRKDFERAYATMRAEMRNKLSDTGSWLAKMHLSWEMLHAVSRTVHVLTRSPMPDLDGIQETGRHVMDMDVGMACNSWWDMSRRMSGARSRQVTLRILPHSLYSKKVTRLTAHFMPFFGLNVLCGLSVQHSNHMPQTVGIVDSVLTSTVTIPPDSHIKRIEVAATQEAIFALYLRVEGHPGYLTLKSGQPSSMYKHLIGRSVLRVPARSRLRGIHLQFDAIKCNAVRLLCDPHIQPSNTYHEHIWQGTPPKIDYFTMKNFVRSAASMWCHHMNFGGRNGEKLGLLSSISTLSNQETGALHGMCFRYQDGQNVRHGGVPFWQVGPLWDTQLEIAECPILGSEGEYVVELLYKIARAKNHESLTGRTYEFICHLQAVTNFKRTLNLQNDQVSSSYTTILRGGSIASSRIQRIITLNAGTTVVGGPFQILEAETAVLPDITPLMSNESNVAA